MVSYRYTAEDQSGHRTDGHVEASSVEEARRKVEDLGLRVLEVIQADSGVTAVPEARLAPEEAQELVESVAQLSAAELPLAPAFRAAAEETDSQRLAQVFNYLASQLERGQTLEAALENSHLALPPHVIRLVRAALKTGQLGPALTELVEHYRDTSSLRQMVRDGLVYPLMVACASVALLTFILAFNVEGFRKIYEGFGVELPSVTVVVLSIREIALVGVPVAILAGVILILILRSQLGRARWHRTLSFMPAAGPMWHWLCLMEWIGLLRVLLRNGMTMLDALRFSADGVSNANVTDISNSLAESVARGRTLAQAMAVQRQVPATLVPLINWGEHTGALDDSLQLSCEMLQDRVRMRAFWIHAALPPILFISIGCTILAVVVSLFLPLIKLISELC